MQERFSPKDYRLMNCVYSNKELTSNLRLSFLDEQLNELEISKVDSHLSNADELERKMKEDSLIEEDRKYNFRLFIFIVFSF